MRLWTPFPPSSNLPPSPAASVDEVTELPHAEILSPQRPGGSAGVPWGRRPRRGAGWSSCALRIPAAAQGGAALLPHSRRSSQPLARRGQTPEALQGPPSSCPSLPCEPSEVQGRSKQCSGVLGCWSPLGQIPSPHRRPQSPWFGQAS